MDDLTALVKKEIKLQYRSVRQFALAADIPLSTVNSAIKNGIGGSSHDMVMHIFRSLGISPLPSSKGDYVTSEGFSLAKQYDLLDRYGRHTVKTVLQVELERCTAVPSQAEKKPDRRGRPKKSNSPTESAN